jgi:hypothetical protein
LTGLIPPLALVFLPPSPVQVPDPEFEGQTKTRLGNPEVRRIVESAASEVGLELGRAGTSIPQLEVRGGAGSCERAGEQAGQR